MTENLKELINKKSNYKSIYDASITLASNLKAKYKDSNDKADKDAAINYLMLADQIKDYVFFGFNQRHAYLRYGGTDDIDVEKKLESKRQELATEYMEPIETLAKELDLEMNPRSSMFRIGELEWKSIKEFYKSNILR